MSNFTRESASQNPSDKTTRISKRKCQTKEKASKKPKHQHKRYYIKVQLKLLDDYVPCDLNVQTEVSVVACGKHNGKPDTSFVSYNHTPKLLNELKVYLSAHYGSSPTSRDANQSILAFNNEIGTSCQATANSMASQLRWLLNKCNCQSCRGLLQPDFAKVEVVEMRLYNKLTITI